MVSVHAGRAPAPARYDGRMPAAELRHKRVPTRGFGHKLIVARPDDGAPVVMEPTAVLVWQQLDDWVTVDDLDRCLATAYPEVPKEDRVAARTEILGVLKDDGFLERR